MYCLFIVFVSYFLVYFIENLFVFFFFCPFLLFINLGIAALHAACKIVFNDMMLKTNIDVDFDWTVFNSVTAWKKHEENY